MPSSDRITGLFRPGTAGEAQYGTAGITFHGPPVAPLALFELTEVLGYPDLGSAASGHFDREPTPCAKARMVWCHQHGLDDRAADGTPIRSYGGTDHSREETIWHPAAFRDGDGYAYGTPTFAPGDRVWCGWNPQSGRWEILAPALNIWRVELRETFLPGDTEAAVAPADDTSAPPIIAHAVWPHQLGIGRGGAAGQPGTRAYIIWSTVRHRWEFLCGQFKLIAEGKAAATIATGTTGTVELWWLDYATGNLADSGYCVAALNWLHPSIASGKKVIVAYDRQEDRWTILAAEG